MPRDRALVIGLDGATYDVLVPLAEQGVMPHVAALLREGALATLRSTRPCLTPAAWTTFQTGVDPLRHGVLDFRYLDHRAGTLRLADTSRIAVPTIFDALRAVGHSVVSLCLPLTWPAPAVQGVVVAGFDSPSIDAALASHPALAARLRASGTRFDFDPIWRRRPRSLEELRHGVEATIADFRGRAAAALIADELCDWRLCFVQFQALDALQHRCWHLLGIDPHSTVPDDWVRETRRALRALDDSVGELVDLAQRRGAAVAVVSDHGFGPFREKIDVGELLRQRGLLTHASGTARLTTAASRGGLRLRKWVFRRRHAGASTATLARGLSAVAAVDRKKTVAVAPHSDLAALVYLNTPERFGRGPVDSPRLREQALADLEAALGEARHPITDEPLFVECLRTAERCGGDPLERMLPELMAIPAPGFHTRCKVRRDATLIAADEDLAGTHREEGVLILHGCARGGGRRIEAHLRDVAPTLLHVLGVPPAAPMEGRALTELVGQSSTTPAAAALQPRQIPAVNYTAHEQSLVEARLRDLGYLD
jgi:predicted AlkP superfamily phosphohydrolase/phosphomutase